MSTFSDDIVKFNGIYKLPVNAIPTLAVSPNFNLLQRLTDFKNILSEEVNEIDEIIAMVQAEHPEAGIVHTPLEVLTALADLFGDIQVYCASEMAKFGLPLDQVLNIIMESNFSKLGADGNPIYDERGKVQKGPGYWKPEPRISAMLESHIRLAESAHAVSGLSEYVVSCDQPERAAQHISAGDADWTPSKQELDGTVTQFQSADVDPMSAPDAQ
jgi:hypothetical protein